jgi:hypothetical protein
LCSELSEASKCYQYKPHTHEERLAKIPSAPIVFVCGNADISFCPPTFTRRIIAAVSAHSARNLRKTFYFQSKKPVYFKQFLPLFPETVILVSTLETNRDEGYKRVSKAPARSKRYQQFKELNYPRKVVTIEPVMDFDEDVFAKWGVDLNPEYVWLGLNSKEKSVVLPEPSEEKIKSLVKELKKRALKSAARVCAGSRSASRVDFLTVPRNVPGMGR